MHRMEFLLKPPTNRSSALLSGNDSSMVFPILSAVLALYYYCNRQNALVREYREHQQTSGSPRVVASIPLRYPDSVDGLFQYRAVTPSRRDERSRGIKRLVVAMSQAGFQGRFEEATAVDKQAADTARSDRLKGKNGGDTWLWAKRYSVTSAFVEEEPEARYLPVACLLASSGGGIFHGGLTRLVVESDADLLLTSPEDTAMRVYGTLRDTNWRNLGTGRRRDVHFVYTQDNQQVADAALLDKPLDKGGVRIGPLVCLSLDLADGPVSFATDALGLIRKKKDGPLRLVSQEAGLLFTLRALSSVMPLRYVPGKCGDTHCLTVEPREGGLPLRLRADQTLIKVDRVVLTGTEAFPGPPREGGGLDTTTVKLKGVMLVTEKGVLYQDAAGTDWKVREGELLLGPTARLDLLVFDSAVSDSAASEAVRSVRQSEAFYADFKTARFRAKVTVDEERYNQTRHRGMRSDSPETDVVVRPQQKQVHWVPAAAATLLAAVAFGSWLWPSRALAYNLGRLAVLCGFALSALSLASFLALSTDRFPWLQKEQDGALFYACTAVAGVSALAVTVSLRFTHSVPAGVYVMGAILVLVVTMIRCMPLENTSELTNEVRSWRSALLLLGAHAGALLAWEAFKMGGKAMATDHAPPVGSGARAPSPLLAVLLLYPLYRGLLKADGTECEAAKMRLRWLHDEVDAGRNVTVNAREIATMEGRTCPGFNQAAGRALGVVVTLAILLYYIGAPVLQRKLVPAAGFPVVHEKTYEPALRYTRVLLGLLPLITVAYILLPRLRPGSSPVCESMRRSSDEFVRQYGNEEGYVFFGAQDKAATIQRRVASEGCVSAETRAIVGVASALAVLWLVSLVVPPRYALSSRRASVAQLVFFIVFSVAQAALFSCCDKQELQDLLEKWILDLA